MKLILSGFAALVLIFALPTQAKGNAEAGQAKSGICAACHGRDGNSPMPKMYPTLAGQSSAELEAKLHAYRKGEGSGGPMAASMIAMAKPLSEDDIANLAAYFSQQQRR